MILHNKNNLPRALFLWKKMLRGILEYRLADQDICQKIHGGFFRKGSWSMRLQKVQDALREKGWEYRYTEEAGLGSIDFEYRGISYHIWEFDEDGLGAESNIRTAGRTEDFTGPDYEEQIVQLVKERQ